MSVTKQQSMMGNFLETRRFLSNRSGSFKSQILFEAKNVIYEKCLCFAT